jgi:hypothetical protein
VLGGEGRVTRFLSLSRSIWPLLRGWEASGIETPTRSPKAQSGSSASQTDGTSPTEMPVSGPAAVAVSHRFRLLESPLPRNSHWAKWGMREQASCAIASRQHVDWVVGLSVPSETSSILGSTHPQAGSGVVPGTGATKSRAAPSLGQRQGGVAAGPPVGAIRPAWARRQPELGFDLHQKALRSCSRHWIATLAIAPRKDRTGCFATECQAIFHGRCNWQAISECPWPNHPPCQVVREVSRCGPTKALAATPKTATRWTGLWSNRSATNADWLLDAGPEEPLPCLWKKTRGPPSRQER